MAIITEEPDSPESLPNKTKPKPRSKPTSPPSQPASTSASTSTTENPFHFWFYFTIVVSLVTFSFVLFSSLSPQDPKTWFLNLPPILRIHYSNGRTIKVQTAPNHPQVEVFSIQRGPVDADSRVLFVHGLGCSSFTFHDVVNYLGRKNVQAVAIDLPGSGFSDKSIAVEEYVGERSFISRLWEVYEEIKEKGLFWGFDQLVQQGYVNFDEDNARVLNKREIIKAIELGSEEMGRVLGQVVNSIGMAPVDLVLHDSALSLSANWISENRGLIRSLVILDGSPNGTALPLWMLGIPVMKDVVLGFRIVFERFFAMCCMSSVGGAEADAHRILLKGRDGGSAVIEMGKKLNFSFDLSEWSSLDAIKGMPIQVIWSEKRSSEGQQIAKVLSQDTVITHWGGRLTQEHNAEEIAENIYEFVSSLPKPTRRVVDEPLPEDVQEMFSEARGSDYHHLHHNGHEHAYAGYTDAYGLELGPTM